MDVYFRQATSGDLTRVAELRWESIVTEKAAQTSLTFEQFRAHFVTWAVDHAATHKPFVAVLGVEVVGVAWLASQARVPSPRALIRANADVQGVYVEPALRSQGIGLGLLRFVLDEAARTGFERVTVHSSEGAVSVYERAGFGQSRLLMQAENHTHRL